MKQLRIVAELVVLVPVVVGLEVLLVALDAISVVVPAAPARRPLPLEDDEEGHPFRHIVSG